MKDTPDQDFPEAPDNAPVEDVLRYVLICARSWVPEARIIGNARAGDIARACERCLALLDVNVGRHVHWSLGILEIERNLEGEDVELQRKALKALRDLFEVPR